MICPFCQHDLDVNGAYCPNCAAAFPTRRGMPFGVKLRSLLLGGVLMTASVLILTECVTTYIQSNTIVPECTTYSTGGNCQVSTRLMWLSQQGSQFSGPDMKSYDLQQMLQMWQQGVQPTQNNPFSLPKKTPSR